MIYYLGFALKQSNTRTNKSLEGMSSIYRILITEVADGTWLLVGFPIPSSFLLFEKCIIKR